MKISIKRWKSHGLRCPDVDISFCKDGTYSKINLILMPNGTGKTTIITLLQHALTGKQISNIAAYKSADYDNDSGVFELELAVDNGANDTKLVLIRIEFDFLENRADFSTSFAPVGIVDRWSPPNDLIPFLRPSCVDAFAFKGDKAKALLDQYGTDASNAVKAFFGFDWIDDAVSKIESEYSSRIRSRATSSSSHQKSLGKKERTLKQWEDHLEGLKRRRDNLEIELMGLTEEEDRLREEIDASLSDDSDLKLEQSEIEARIKSTESDINKYAEKLMNALRNPAYVADEITNKLNDLKENLDELQLPGTSKIFFDELVASYSKCICDRPFDDKSRSAVLENSRSFLADEEVTVVNGIKQDINKYTEKAEGLKAEELSRMLSGALQGKEEAYNELQSHENKKRDLASDEDRGKLDRWRDMGIQIATISDEISELTGNDFADPDLAIRQGIHNCTNIHVTDSVIKKLLKEISIATNAAEEYEKKELVVSILKEASIDAYTHVTEILKERSNDKLESILTEGTNIKITSIGKNIEIAAGDVRRESASGGESASIAYSFVNAVLEESGVRFPLLVDHPVTALQYEARAPLARAIQAVSHQFIGFLINTEIGGFVTSFSDPPPYFYTLFRNIKGNQKYIDRAPNDNGSCVETQNGFLCTDRDFFLGFKGIGEIDV